MSNDNKRILIVEDNPGLARALEFQLRRAGFDVTLCLDGANAWDELEGGSFDALVTDHKMPGMVGEQLIRKMRELPRYAEIPVIMVTGRELELDIRRMQAELNLTAVYPKPYSPRELVQTLNEQLAPAEVGE